MTPYIIAAFGWGLSIHFYVAWRNAELRIAELTFSNRGANERSGMLIARIRELESLRQPRESNGRFKGRGK